MTLAFPFRIAEVRFDVGALAGWLALIPFAWMLEGLGPRAAFRWGAGAASLAFGVILYWIYVVVAVHGHAPPWAAVASVGLLAVYVGLHCGLSAALYAALAPHAGALRCLVLPAAWVAGEHLRSFDLLGGFPWAYLGYAVHLDGPMLELAALAGVWGLSFLLAVVAVLAAERRLVPALALFAAAHALGFGLGLAQRVNETPADGEPPRVAIVQGDIPQDQKWDRERIGEAFARHLELSRVALATGSIELLVWPETAVPMLLEHEPAYQEKLAALARESGSVLIVGGIGFERRPASAPRPDGRDYQLYNSAFAIASEGLLDRYDKSHLVPFGEYVPGRGVMGALSAVASGLTLGDVTPGPGPRVLRRVSLGSEAHALAPLICYEVIYPGLVRAAVRGGGRLLLNLTNDAWYGRTSAPHQFLAIAALRSAEHGLPMLRAANTGVSAVIDAGGVVLRETPIFEQRVLTAPLPAPRAGTTLYTRWGDWLVGLCWALLIGIGGFRIVGIVRGNRREDPRGEAGAERSGGARG